MRQGPIHAESLMDLLKRQQSRGQIGLSWGLHKDLMSEVAFDEEPYRFCAMSGRTELAAILHRRGLPHSGDATAAYLSAAGVNGSTQWVKSLQFSTEELALLAGHAETAAVLHNIKLGIPLDWTQKNHARYPDSFKQQARAVVEAVARCSWFSSLPGPVRCRIVDLLMDGLARAAFWSMLPVDFWDTDDTYYLFPDLECKTLQKVIESHAERNKGTTRQRQAPQYHLRFAAGHAVAWRRWRWPRTICSAVALFGVAMVSHKVGVSKLPIEVALAMGASNPASAGLAVLTIMLRRLRGHRGEL